MKYRLIASLILVVILVALVFIFEGNSNSGASFQAPSGFEDAKSFKIN